jgi:hypothetical protein
MESNIHRYDVTTEKHENLSRFCTPGRRLEWKTPLVVTLEVARPRAYMSDIWLIPIPPGCVSAFPVLNRDWAKLKGLDKAFFFQILQKVNKVTGTFRNCNVDIEYLGMGQQIYHSLYDCVGIP